MEQQIKDMVVVLLEYTTLAVAVVPVKQAIQMERIMAVMVSNHPLVELPNIMRVVAQETQILGFQHQVDKVVVVLDGIQVFLQIQKYNLR